MQQRKPGVIAWGWYWLLLVPYVAMLWVPTFNRIPPAIAGVPFFYWYQFLWIALTALIVWAVYLLAHGGDRK